MRSRTLRFLLVTGGALPLMVSGCVPSSMTVTERFGPAPEHVYVRVAPPPPPAEEVIVGAPGYSWVGGHWRWHDTGARYVWEPGHVQRVPEGYRTWAPGHWQQHARGWFWIDGHWS